MSKTLKNYFGPERETLGNVESPYWNGLRIVTIGILLALLAAVFVALGLESIGKVLFISGFLFGVVGILFHFISMFIWFVKGKHKNSKDVNN